MGLPLRIAVPMLAPFAIVVCDPRWELVAVAAWWSVFIVPGVVATAVLLPRDHPLAALPATLATSTAAALVPFSLVAWLGARCHWTLGTVVAVHVAIAIAATTAIAVIAWRRRAPVAFTAPGDAASGPTAALRRRSAACVLGLLGLVLVGFVWANRVTATRPFHRYRLTWWAGGTLEPIGGTWWIGAALAIAAAIAAAIVLARRVRPDEAPGPAGARGRTALWVVAAALVVLVMRVTYGMPAAAAPSRAAWDPDDVSYVSEAIDAAAGLPLGSWEASLGGELDATRSATSIVGAPLVAAISQSTGISPAALHHAVLPPLVILLGASALAAALAVVFRRDRWLVPLGIVVGLAALAKSWDYPGSFAQVVVYQTVQPKAVHLWFALPLQLATVALVIARPGRTSAFAAIGAAIVAAFIHPLAIIIGAVWTAVAVIVAAAARRRATAGAVVVLVVYGALGLEMKLALAERPIHPPASDRIEGEVRESRDLVRAGDQPQLRQDPQLLFGGESLFFLGVLGAPIALGVGIGRRRTELVLVGALGVVGVACCALEPLGRVLGLALHPAIMWRARWLVPAPVLIAVLAAGVLVAARTLIGRTTVAAAVAAAAVVAAVAADHAIAIRPGPPPARLDKLSPAIDSLVAALGGEHAAPFVWAPRYLLLELPQAMPRVELIYSLDKLMRPAAVPDFRARVKVLTDRFARDRWTAADLAELCAMYPVDHVVVSARATTIPAVLAAAGWIRSGAAGPFDVWQATEVR